VSTDKTALPYLEGDTDTLADAIQPTYWHGLDLIPANLALYGADSRSRIVKRLKRISFLPGAETRIATVSAHYD